MGCHWQSTLMAINPQALTEHQVNIVSVIVAGEGIDTALSIKLQRSEDGLEGCVQLFHVDYLADDVDPETTAVDRIQLPKVIQDLLTDFGLTSPDELVDSDSMPRQAIGIYYGNRVVAIKKPE
jgi:hypothetical protein